MQRLQVCWEESRIVCFVLFAFSLQGWCSWPNSSDVFGLVQPHPAPILWWWPNEQAQAPVSVQQCQ